MNITTTTKRTNNSYDTYNITFDNSKLKNMLNQGIINENVYNFWSENNGKTLTKESNMISTISIQFHTFQNVFYIQDNKMHFVNKDHPNPNIVNFKDELKLNNIFPQPNDLTEPTIESITDWWKKGYITVEEQNKFVDWLSDLEETITPEEIENKLYSLLEEWIIEEEYDVSEIIWEILLVFVDTLVLDNLSTNKKEILDELVENYNLIKSTNKGYGVEEIFDGST